VAAGRLGGTVDAGVSGRKVGEELGGLPGQGVEVEVPVPELGPVSGRGPDLLGSSLNVGDAAGVHGHHLGDGGDPRPGERFEVGPAIQHRQRGGARPGERVPHVRERPPGLGHDPAQAPVGVDDRLAPPLRCTRASSIVVGMRAGRSSKNSPARESNAASIGSDLFLLANAERNRAGWRLPTSDSSTPALRRAIDDANHVIDVGSATAAAPGHDTSRLVNRLYATKRGWRPLIRATGGVCHSTPQWSSSRRR
jgi:hypothetical protein